MEKNGELANLRVLFIDDDTLLRSSMYYYFRKKTASFVVLESAEDAFPLLARETFDVVICDYRLGGMNGIDFFKRLKESHPNIKRILTSAYLEERVIEEAVRAGVHDLLPKLLDAGDVRRSLKKIMDDS